MFKDISFGKHAQIADLKVFYTSGNSSFQGKYIEHSYILNIELAHNTEFTKKFIHTLKPSNHENKEPMWLKCPAHCDFY